MDDFVQEFNNGLMKKAEEIERSRLMILKSKEE